MDRNFKQLTPPFLNEAGLLSRDFEKELLTKKVTVRKMPYLPPTTNSFASDSYDHQLKKFTKDVSNHTLHTDLEGPKLSKKSLLRQNGL